MANCKAVGLTTTRIVEGYRSVAKQNEYYAIGRTVMNSNGPRPGKPLGDVVTNAKGGQSFHQYGIAFDIYTTDYKKAGQIGKSIGLEWGGDWKGNLVDRPHFELKKGYKLKDFLDNKVDYTKYD